MAMRARYVRLYADAEGVSRFEDREVQLAPGFAVPPAEPLFAADFLPTEGSFWVGAPTDWKGEAPHPAPRRQVFVALQGSYDITAGDGTVRSFGPGSVLLLEDTDGAGHATRITSPEPCLLFAVKLR